MMWIVIQSITYVAAFLKCLMWLPQIVKIFQHKSVNGVSIWTQILLSFVADTWVIYAALLGFDNLTLYIVNAFFLVITNFIIFTLYYYTKIKSLIGLIIFNFAALLGSICILCFYHQKTPFALEVVFAILAGTASASAFLPQAFKTWKLKAIANFSIILGWIRFISMGLWVINFTLMYFYYDNLVYMINMAFITLAFLCVIPILYVYYFKEQKHRV